MRRIHLILVCVLLLSMTKSYADQNVRVTNTNDSGPGSLRNAIEQTNDRPGRDTIVFDSQLRGQTIALTSGELRITDDLTIRGLGANRLVLSGERHSRVFFIQASDIIRVRIVGLSITGGFVDGEEEDGGGIVIGARARLTVVRSIIAGNRTLSGAGGGINLRPDAALLVKSSIITGNLGAGGGGGIHNSGGRVTLRDSSLTGNSGAGISNFSGIVRIVDSTIEGNRNVVGSAIHNADGRVKVIRSRIMGNTALRSSGGIHNRAEGVLDVVDSNIIGNRTDGSGGGVFNAGHTTVTNSDITLNAADFDNDGAGSGGGVFNAVAATFTNNESRIFGNTPDDVFNE